MTNPSLPSSPLVGVQEAVGGIEHQYQPSTVLHHLLPSGGVLDIQPEEAS